MLTNTKKIKILLKKIKFSTTQIKDLLIFFGASEYIFNNKLILY